MCGMFTSNKTKITYQSAPFKQIYLIDITLRFQNASKGSGRRRLTRGFSRWEDVCVQFEDLWGEAQHHLQLVHHQVWEGPSKQARDLQHGQEAQEQVHCAGLEKGQMQMQLQMLLCFSREIFKLHANIFSVGEISCESSPSWTLGGILKSKSNIYEIKLFERSWFVCYFCFVLKCTCHTSFQCLATVIFTLCRNILSKCWILFSFSLTHSWISRSKWQLGIKWRKVSSSTDPGLSDSVKHFYSSPHISREIQKTKVETVLRDTLYLKSYNKLHTENQPPRLLSSWGSYE